MSKNSVVLFQGDSVTDADRDYGNPANMGAGYASMISSWFSAMYPERDVTFINSGVSGNRVKDLKERWKEDCIDLQPTWVSILIGINDTWRKYDSNDPTSVQTFEDDYRYLLHTTQEEINPNIILCEPFVLPYPEDRISWREDLDPKIHVVRKLAREFNTTLIPLDGVFAQAATKKPSEFWAFDGVHPTAAGHALIAQQWLKTVNI